MQQALTLSKTIWPGGSRADNPYRWAVRGVTLATVFSALIGVCAHLQFHLGFTPVPVTGQTFAVLLAGALLGPRLGALTLLLYIAEACVGLPVLAPGSNPTCYGYVVGFVVAAALVGWLAERGWDRMPLSTAAMMAAGSAVIYVFGVAWMSPMVGGLDHAFEFGVAPFLIGDALKAAAAAALLPMGWRLVGRIGSRTRDAS